METEITRRQRVAAYGICVRDNEVLLTRYIGGDRPRWTLPGGGIDHGEDPYRAVQREIAEETGHVAEVRQLLGIHSWQPDEQHHGLRIVYEVEIVGGVLRNEIGGSTDLAAWFSLGEVEQLERVALVDYGLDLFRDRPADGHPRRHRVDSSG